MALDAFQLDGNAAGIVIIKYFIAVYLCP